MLYLDETAIGKQIREVGSQGGWHVIQIVMFKITKLPHVKADENGDYLAFAHAAFTVASRVEILLF